VSTFDDLLSGRPAQIQATARAARSFIRSLGTDLVEHIRGSEASYGRPKPFCRVAIERGEVALRFPNSSLPDPRWLLHGADQAIRLRGPADFSDAVRALIRAAYKQAT
jgi:hypothetical protein